MRRIAIINQKGGVGKTTTAANLGAALARAGRRVLVIDMDPQANLSLYLGVEPRPGETSVYRVLTEGLEVEQATRATATEGLWLLPSHIDLSGAELELASTIGRETILRDALDAWDRRVERDSCVEPVDYVLLDCPPSLGLLSVNALTAASEVFVAVQTEFFALQGLGKLVEVVQLLRRRLNPRLNLTGLVPCLYDSRLRLAREVLAELRRFFPGKVFQSSICSNVKLAESPSHAQTIFEYAPDSRGAKDYASLAQEVIAQEVPAAPPPPPPGRDGEDALLGVTAAALREAETVTVQAADSARVPSAPPNPPPAEPAPTVAASPPPLAAAQTIAISARWDEGLEESPADSTPLPERADPAPHAPIPEAPPAVEEQPAAEAEPEPVSDAAAADDPGASAPFGAGVTITTYELPRPSAPAAPESGAEPVHAVQAVEPSDPLEDEAVEGHAGEDEAGDVVLEPFVAPPAQEPEPAAEPQPPESAARIERPATPTLDYGQYLGEDHPLMPGRNRPRSR